MQSAFTHPDYATLVDPLFACGGKRVGCIRGNVALINSRWRYACRPSLCLRRKEGKKVKSYPFPKANVCAVI